MSAQNTADNLLTLTSQIVSAHLSKNAVAMNDVSELIQRVYATLQGLTGATPATVATKPPAVPVKKSVTSEYIVCLEDGTRHKMMKRYLKTAFDMTPDEYRKKWGLPPDYPMVSPNYAKTRSALAKKSGLGLRTKRRGRR
ncbi:MAG: MucR family transcriptional regulator [Reyranellaceae bacterium]